jgi:hypothetical protein
MNSLTHDGQSYEFSTADELLALPIVRKYTSDPAVSKLGYNRDCLAAFVGNPPIEHIIGRLKEPVMLPASISGRAP